MKSLQAVCLAGVFGFGTVSLHSIAAAQREAPLTSANRMHSDTTAAPLHEPPGGKYTKVSSLVPLPDFVPGLGTLYVDPATLPAGPRFSPTTTKGTRELDLHDPAQGPECA